MRRRPINHGTLGGYRTHYRHKVPMCEPCRNAERVFKGRRKLVLAPCGTRGAYARHLRAGEATCAACRAANTAAGREWRRTHNPTALSPWDPRHGTINGYSNYKCPCGPCRQANARASADRRARESKKKAA